MQKINVARFYRSQEEQKKIPIELNIGKINDIRITGPVAGRVIIFKANNNNLIAEFDLEIFAELECQRCLEKFEKKSNLKFTQDYSTNPKEGQLKIYPDLNIDILEPVSQEFLVNLPYKMLCQQNCQGLCSRCGQNLNKKDIHKCLDRNK